MFVVVAVVVEMKEMEHTHTEAKVNGKNNNKFSVFEERQIVDFYLSYC